MISITHPPYVHHHLHKQTQQQPAQTYQHRTTSQPINYSTTASLGLDSINSLAGGALPNGPMQSDTWGSLAQYTSDKMGRMPHQRESSLSSMGSTGPASPYNQSTSNPHIAITDSTGDELSDMHSQDAGNQNGSYYQLAKSVGNPYAGYQNLDQTIPEMAYPVTIPGPSSKPRMDRGLLPAPELSGHASRSHPASVASSVAGDSPATPTVGNDNNHNTNCESMDKRRKDGYGNVPKLDRTMTDVYGDELYSPNFAITSTPPTQPQQLTTVSPPNDVFSQRLNAANNQHLSVGHSPVSSTSRDRSSPFRPGSPFAHTSNQDFSAPPQNMAFNTMHRMRDQSRVQQDTQMLRQQMTKGPEPETPKTISPKDAMLEFNDPDGEASLPLFPQNSTNLGMDQLAKMMGPQAPSQPFMPGPNAADGLNYMPSQMSTGLQVPQQYPFIARSQPASNTSPPRLSSSGSSSGSGSSTPANLVRPAGVAADGGTYTCTYHGCTLRFETPALLQKHKREGHRQNHGLTTARPQDMGMTSSMLNSQAGPHRCDRINPSTGKPCGTVFSRPYDLTRHEDTIHNARKQKVRCDLCTEEKTFSRADALTRHYRVCHPDVELPGKHRRRGGG